MTGTSMWARVVAVTLAAAVGCIAANAGGGDDRAGAPGDDYARWASPDIASLQDLSIEALRERGYAAKLEIIERLGTAAGESDYSQHYLRRGGMAYDTFLAEYRSDGQRVYARIDIPPGPMPPLGYPAVIFLHGWYSNEDSPAFDFSYRPGTLYADTIDAFVQAGFLVVYPGWRGYGTVQGRPADGMAFLEAWNNASYLMPVFFAIDVLNLLEGLPMLERNDWQSWRHPAGAGVRIDPGKVHIAGHSQGGDAALIALAVSGEGSGVRGRIAAASIWAGCFASRFEQLEMYVPVDSNLARQYQEMYDALNAQVADLGDAKFGIRTGEYGTLAVTHDPRVAAAMQRIGGYAFPRYLREPLNLHFSDEDVYSIPAWNDGLARRINRSGGASNAFLYPGNTHALDWERERSSSRPGVVPGFRLMLARDIALFRGEEPGSTRETR